MYVFSEFTYDILSLHFSLFFFLKPQNTLGEPNCNQSLALFRYVIWLPSMTVVLQLCQCWSHTVSVLTSKPCHLWWTVLILGNWRSSWLCYCSDATLGLKSLLLQHWNKNAKCSPLNFTAKFSLLLHSHIVLSETLTSFYRLISQEFSEQLVHTWDSTLCVVCHASQRCVWEHLTYTSP